MSKRKQAPQWIKNEVKQDDATCTDCKIEFQCAVLKEVNRMSKASGGNHVNHEFGCNWLQEKNSN